MENEKNKSSNSSQINKENIESSNKNEIKEENKLKYMNESYDNEILYLNIFIENLKKNYNNKDNKLKEKSKSVIKEYIENKDIIKNKEKLISFIEELSFILNTGNNTIIPFLDLCPFLIKSYIESDLDEETGENELKYIKIFELLKYNSFISREYLYPIYDYFSHLFYIKNSIIESDKRLNKFKKMIELWNIFYTFYPENYSQIECNEDHNEKAETKSMKKNFSFFCFLGSGIIFKFKEKITYEDCLIIEITFSKNFLIDLNNNLIILNLASKDNNFQIKISDLQKKTKKMSFL